MKNTSRDSTVEPQYDVTLELKERKGFARFGLMSNFTWEDDPRHLAFTFSRYKFVSKMLSGRSHVLEVGCGDAFFTRLVRQEVDRLTATDIDPVFVEDAAQTMSSRWDYEIKTHNMLTGPLEGPFDGAYSLDVLEHIEPEDERTFLSNVAASLTPHGVFLVGSPSLESQAYASAASKAGHVNCKDEPSLKKLMSEFFENVFMFSMNDEVVHTGYAPMAHYRFALGCTRKSQ